DRVEEELRRIGAIIREVGFAHGRMGDGPLLWSADAVSWAVQCNIARGDGRFSLPALREGRLTVIDAVDGMPLNMNHPLGASAFARGPSAQRPGLSGSPEHDVASPSTAPARLPGEQ